jgi:hypothetical protein
MLKYAQSIIVSILVTLFPITSFAGVGIGDWELTDVSWEGTHSCKITYESYLKGVFLEVGKSNGGVAVVMAYWRSWGELEYLSDVPAFIDNGVSERRFQISFVGRDYPFANGYSRIVLGDYDRSDIYHPTDQADSFLDHIAANQEFSVKMYHRKDGEKVLFNFDLEGTKQAIKLFNACRFNH